MLYIKYFWNSLVSWVNRVPKGTGFTLLVLSLFSFLINRILNIDPVLYVFLTVFFTFLMLWYLPHKATQMFYRSLIFRMFVQFMLVIESFLLMSVGNSVMAGFFLMSGFFLLTSYNLEILVYFFLMLLLYYFRLRRQIFDFSALTNGEGLAIVPPKVLEEHLSFLLQEKFSFPLKSTKSFYVLYGQTRGTTSRAGTLLRRISGPALGTGLGAGLTWGGKLQDSHVAARNESCYRWIDYSQDRINNLERSAIEKSRFTPKFQQDLILMRRSLLQSEKHVDSCNIPGIRVFTGPATTNPSFIDSKSYFSSLAAKLEHKLNLSSSPKPKIPQVWEFSFGEFFGSFF